MHHALQITHLSHAKRQGEKQTEEKSKTQNQTQILLRLWNYRKFKITLTRMLRAWDIRIYQKYPFGHLNDQMDISSHIFGLHPWFLAHSS